MKKKLHLIALTTFLGMNAQAQFNMTAQNWTVPTLAQYADDIDQVNGGNYSLVDINGDGFPDLVDAQDNVTYDVWLNGNSPYWKVYLGNGSSFSTTAQNWPIPLLENYANGLNTVNAGSYSLVDINGDGKPDLVDAQDNNSGVVWLGTGGLGYWKVYLNNGTSFSTTAQNWTIPTMESYAEELDQVNGLNYSLVDINGDGKPDLVDAQDNNSGVVWLGTGGLGYWKVYLNNGSSFSTTAQNWTIPTMESYAEELDQISGQNYSLVDINGDGKPDLVDAQDNNSGVVWLGTGGLGYWKVYLNNGTSFSTTAQNWTIPTMENYAEELDQISGQNYSLLDMNGDGTLDLVDAQDNSSGVVWLGTGSVPYWKVYPNSGSAFSTTAQSWTIPVVETYVDDLDQVNGANYTIVDMNGDRKPDMVDAQNNASGVVWLGAGNVPYWKVYLNTTVSPYLGIENPEMGTLVQLNVYPNPTTGTISINLSDLENENQVRISNSAGVVIYDKAITEQVLFNFDLSEYQSGLYFITVTNSNQVYNAKVIKE
ncbi:T9SS type A sorting domain-containing protein [Fluviicola taffensis]|nr:T9SS type A sorting domain-containing protein [Fluviicola taffensis]